MIKSHACLAEDYRSPGLVEVCFAPEQLPKGLISAADDRIEKEWLSWRLISGQHVTRAAPAPNHTAPRRTVIGGR
jgi:hypothetical protein